MKNKSRNYAWYTLPDIENMKQMIRERAYTKPDAICFSYPDENGEKVSVSFLEYYHQVNGLGTWLYMNGMTGGKHIAVIGENSYPWLLAFGAVVSGGNAAVPIDKDLKPAEAVRNIRKADCEMILCADSSKALIEPLGGSIPVLYMSDFEEAVKAGAERIRIGDRRFVDCEIDPESVCCILFTSGTTGVAKGAVLTNYNIREELNRTCRNFKLEGNTVAVLPFHHAFGLIVGIWMVFNYGFETYINKSLRTISKALVDEKPQTMFLVPLFVEAFHKQIWREAKKKKADEKLKKAMKISNGLLKTGIDMRSRFFDSVLTPFGRNLQYVICGGAKLEPFYVKEFRSWGIEVLNGYGMTECSPVISVNRNFYHRDGTVGIGIPGSEFKIAEDGEVLVKGPFVMREYYKEPELTAEAVTDGWYHTGDIGFMDKDGFLTLTGRKKNLIILSNGENISPEELEGDISLDDGVEEVLVYEENKQIVAEIFPAEEKKGDKAYFKALIDKINDGRPIYKQINEVRLREEEFEKNTSHKILRKK